MNAKKRLLSLEKQLLLQETLKQEKLLTQNSQGNFIWEDHSPARHLKSQAHSEGQNR